MGQADRNGAALRLKRALGVKKLRDEAARQTVGKEPLLSRSIDEDLSVMGQK